MSLEQQVTALVASANALTGAVNGKIGQIDQKVDEATASVPGVIKAMSRGVFYVDCTYGNDANNGSSLALAVKTIGALADKFIPGGSYTVYLTVGEHYLESVSFLGDVRFQSLGDNVQYLVSNAIASNQPITLDKYTKVTVRKSLNVDNVIYGNGIINFYNCLISHDLNEGDFVAKGGVIGFVLSALIVAPSVQFSISGFDSDDYNVPLCAISGYGGNTLSSVGWEVLAVKGKVNKVIGGNNSMKGLLAVASNTLINRGVKSDGVTASVLYDAADFKGVIGS